MQPQPASVVHDDPANRASPLRYVTQKSLATASLAFASESAISTTWEP